MDLKKLRTEKGWSQEQLAEISGVSARTIQRLEKGEKPGMETLKALSAGFEISGSELKKATMDKKELKAMDTRFLTPINKEWRGFFLHLLTFMVVITWLYGLAFFFELDNEFVGIVGLPWGMLLVFHAFKNFGSEKPGK
ncbi:MAG: helix-turn-helix domain-containing protein [Alphaproteobacteria bacterium]